MDMKRKSAASTQILGTLSLYGVLRLTACVVAQLHQRLLAGLQRRVREDRRLLSRLLETAAALAIAAPSAP